MKSLFVTAVVLSSFATPVFAAEQPDQKGQHEQQQAPGGAFQQPRDQRGNEPEEPRGGHAVTKRPDVTKQPVISPKSESAQPPAAQHQQRHQSAPVQASTPVTPKVQPATHQVKATPAPKAPPAGQVSSRQHDHAVAQGPVKTPPAPKGQTAQAHPATQPNPRTAAREQVPAHLAQAHSETRPVAPAVLPKSVLTRNQLIVQQNSHVHNFVEQRTAAYRTAYGAQLATLQKRYLAPAYLAPLRVAYRPWVKVGFLAYAYPVRPVVDFYTYFSNPCVSWFYNEYDAEYYQPYYGQYFQRFPELRRGYTHIGIYLPTEEFMAMNVALSDLSIEAQVNYRRAMIFLGDRLAERYRAPITRHQVIVNHYVMLPSNRAVVVEGFIDNESTQMPFKALVDLNNADNSELFAVGQWKAEETPSVEQSQDLFDLNDQIVDYGGSIETPPQS